MEVRVVAAGRGWQWIAGGFALFRKSPAMWAAITLILYVIFTLLVRIPVLGLILVIFAPVLLAGLMQGCRALEAGEELKVAHLLTGFRKNAGYLVTLGGISLVSNLVLLMMLVMMSGDAVMAMMKHAAAGSASPAVAEAVLQAAPRIVTATLVVFALSLPLLMSLWFAPLLVHFDDFKPLRSLVMSFWACWKNTLPFLVYGAVVFLGLVVLTPFTLAARQPDLSFWLLAPVLIPSIYASYQDVFTPSRSASTTGGNPFLK